MKRLGLLLIRNMGLLIGGCETGTLPGEGGEAGDELIKQLGLERPF